LTFGTRA